MHGEPAWNLQLFLGWVLPDFIYQETHRYRSFLCGAFTSFVILLLSFLCYSISLLSQVHEVRFESELNDCKSKISSAKKLCLSRIRWVGSAARLIIFWKGCWLNRIGKLEISWVKRLSNRSYLFQYVEVLNLKCLYSWLIVRYTN